MFIHRMIKSNEYFDGNVKSLGYQTEVGSSTVGVMQPGEYEFSTGSPEIMTVIEGAMDVLLKGETDWETYEKGQSFDVPANSTFKVKMEVQTSYLCQF